MRFAGPGVGAEEGASPARWRACSALRLNNFTYGVDG
jgi:hypothetical protein